MSRIATAARRTGRILLAALAAAILLALLGGLPWLLVTWIGWPLPDHVPSLAEGQTVLASPISDGLLFDALAILAWAAWALFVRDLITETLALAADTAETRRTGRPIERHRGGGPVRLVAALLIGTIAAVVLAQHTRTLAAPGASTTDPHLTRPPAAVSTRSPATPATADSRPPTNVGPADAEPTATRPDGPRPALRVPPRHPDTTLAADTAAGHPATPSRQQVHADTTYTVTDGDNLWDIAGRQLGDPTRWREIYLANRGHPQPDGYTLDDPDEIHIGWQLHIPAARRDDTPPPPHPPAHAHQPATPQTPPPPPTSGPPTSEHDTPPPDSAPAAPHSGPHTTRQQSPADAPPAASSSTGVLMGSGAWIGTGLAVALGTTALAASLYRRQRRRLRWPIPTTSTPTRHHTPGSLTDAITAGTDALHTTDPPHPAPASPPPLPAVDAAIGVDAAGREYGLETLTRTGLTLTGPGAPAALRAALAAALSAGTLADGDHHITVFTTARLLGDLLPDGAQITGVDPEARHPAGERLRISATTDQAILGLEQELLFRRRLLDSYDAEIPDGQGEGHDWVNANGYALLIAPADYRYTTRIQTILSIGTDLRLGALLLGEAPDTPSLTVASDGTVTSTAGTLATLSRVATLTAAELADIADLVRAAAPPPHHDATTPPSPTPAPPTAADPSPAHNAATIAPAAPVPTATSPDLDRLVHLAVLGAGSVTVDGTQIRGLTGTRYAILAYLAAHPHGATRDQILEALYPDPQAASSRFRTACTEIRRFLRTATGRADERFILNDTHRYRLDPHTFTIDLWHMLSALHDANTSTDNDTAQLAALHRAADAYHGEFGDGLSYLWVTEFATTYRAQAVDALARIAAIHETDQPDAAITALRRAIDHDPVCEELYQRLMRIHGRLGQPDAVRRTLQQCTAALDKIQAEPSETTMRIAHRQLRLPARQSTPARA